jgi:hypothetical protein
MAYGWGAYLLKASIGFHVKSHGHSHPIVDPWNGATDSRVMLLEYYLLPPSIDAQIMHRLEKKLQKLQNTAFSRRF